MPKSLDETLDFDYDAAIARIMSDDETDGEFVDMKHIRGLADVRHRRTRLEAEMVERVVEAREANVSWNAIGSIIGTTGEAARQRYGKFVPKKPKKSA